MVSEHPWPETLNLHLDVLRAYEIYNCFKGRPGPSLRVWGAETPRIKRGIWGAATRQQGGLGRDPPRIRRGIWGAAAPQEAPQKIKTPSQAQPRKRCRRLVFRQHRYCPARVREGKLLTCIIGPSKMGGVKFSPPFDKS